MCAKGALKRVAGVIFNTTSNTLPRCVWLCHKVRSHAKHAWDAHYPLDLSGYASPNFGNYSSRGLARQAKSVLFLRSFRSTALNLGTMLNLDLPHMIGRVRWLVVGATGLTDKVTVFTELQISRRRLDRHFLETNPFLSCSCRGTFEY